MFAKKAKIKNHLFRKVKASSGFKKTHFTNNFKNSCNEVYVYTSDPQAAFGKGII